LSLLSVRLTNSIAEAPPTKFVRELELTPQIWPEIGAVAFAITEFFGRFLAQSSQRGD
jgi:hypothetical protein